LRIPACSASIRATPDTAYNTGNFTEQDSSSRLQLAPTTSRAEEKNAQGGGSASRVEKEGRRCVVSRALHFRPGLDLELDIGKKKEKENTEKKEKQIKKGGKKRLSNIRGFSFSTLTKISNKVEKSVEFILKKENIPGQVFSFSFPSYDIKKLAKFFKKVAK
jgi:hypothetical protein